MKKLLTIIVLILSNSCGQDRTEIPADIIQKEEFTKILYEVELVDAIHTQNHAGNDKQDVVTLSHYEQIFIDFEITEDEFNRSYKFYEKHPELMLEIIDTLSNQFILLEDSISEELNKAKWRRKKH